MDRDRESKIIPKKPLVPVVVTAWDDTHTSTIKRLPKNYNTNRHSVAGVTPEKSILKKESSYRPKSLPAAPGIDIGKKSRSVEISKPKKDLKAPKVRFAVPEAPKTELLEGILKENYFDLYDEG